MHKVESVGSGVVTGGSTTERTRFALPVDKDSKDVKLPAAIAGGDSARDQMRREKLRPFVEALMAHLGGGQLSVQDAGNFLGTLPGWRAAVTELRMGNQNVRQILDLFSELQVGATVKRT